MSVKNLKKKSETDWGRIDRMTDDEIDTSDIPPLTDAFFERARKVLPRIYIDRLDLIEARKLAGYILKKGWPNKQNKLAHSAFNTALIISYARPFTMRHNLEGHRESLLDKQVTEVLIEKVRSHCISESKRCGISRSRIQTPIRTYSKVLITSANQSPFTNPNSH